MSTGEEGTCGEEMAGTGLQCLEALPAENDTAAAGQGRKQQLAAAADRSPSLNRPQASLPASPSPGLPSPQTKPEQHLGWKVRLLGTLPASISAPAHGQACFAGWILCRGVLRCMLACSAAWPGLL
jgi:hypothetical protein